jgi:putative thioredoxin
MTTNQPAPEIVETTDATFERDVFERSKDVPVVVDFWAAWCQPCRMLAPLLEQAAREAPGKFVLVKAETDHCPRAAAEFNVQSIPAVFGVCGGEAVDFFQGLLSPDQLKQWLERLLDLAEFTRAGKLEATDPAGAEAVYHAFAEKHPNEPRAQIGLARALLAQGRCDECREIIERLAARGFLEPEAEKVKAAVDLSGKESLDLAACRAAAERDPKDLEARWQLAQALAGHGEHQGALDQCLELVRLDRKGLGEQARLLMLEIFRVLPEDSELTNGYRRKLSSALY